MAHDLLEELNRLIGERVRRLEEEHSTPVKSLNSQTFEKTLAENEIVVVLYSAPWCQPCKAFEPLYELVARRLSRDKRVKDRVVFAKVDTDAEPEIADKQHIDRIPSVVIYYRGTPADVIVGAVGEEELVRRILQVVEKS
jgi:thioredoxin-like negative regulator of GroEL